MSEYIEVGQPLQFTDPNTPTRVGEIVESVSDIYNIPSPRLGMQVFVKREKKSFVITSLKSKVIGGVDVPEAAVEAFEPAGAKSITWNNDTDPSNMNDFVTAGVYDIKGEHKREDDNLPVLNTGGGHSFNARLTVLDSSISGSGKDDDKCITQVLSFSNRLGQGEVYIRTGKGSSLDSLSWEKWSTLQRNVNVGEVGSLDDLIDNGIYSGVLIGTGETFVLVVINNYAVVGNNMPRSISQFKYSVNPNGVVSFGKRVKVGDNAFPADWEILNYEEINSMISAEIEKESQRAQTMEQQLQDWMDADKQESQTADDEIKANAMQYNTLGVNVYADKAELYGRSIDSKVRTVDFPAATPEKAGVMSSEDKNMLFDINSRLGHGAETIVLKASDLIPMTWNGTKMVSSTNFNVWIVPLNEGVQYSVENTPFIHTRRTCSEYPALGTELPMTSIPSSAFTATADMKYLVITVTMSAYDGSDYELSASGHGLMNEFNSLKTRVNETYELSMKTQNHLLQTESELSACIGSKDRTIVLTSNDYDNLLWNGTSFANANNSYNGFVVPIYPGERIRYTAPQANNVCTLTDYPTIGSSERVRTRTDFNDVYAKGDFIVQDNEHYLFLNTTVATHDSYEVVGGKGALNVQLDGLRELQNPLNGKTIVCFGDSLTEFNGEGGKGYGDYLAELSGAKVVRGGIGGTQLATRREPVETIPDTDIAYQHAYGAVDISNLVKAWANNDWAAVDNAVAWLAENKNDDNSAVIERLKNCPIASTDVVIVFGGSNDLNNGTYGKPDDTNPLQNTCGGINQIIDSILSVKPDMTIYFFTPIPRMATSEVWCDDYRTDQSDAHGSLSFPSLVKRIKECVEYNHIPCCDMYHTIGINRKNIYTYARDGVHVTRAFRKIANRIYGFIMENRIWQ